MALEKDVNSYTTVAEADAYFADRLGSEKWTAADNTKKERALITGSRALNDYPWSGSAKSTTLAFPRTGSYYDPALGYDVPMDPVPQRIITASLELALHLLTNPGVLSAQSSFDSISVGDISLDYRSTMPSAPPVVAKIIRPLLIAGGSAGDIWWRAN